MDVTAIANAASSAGWGPQAKSRQEEGIVAQPLVFFPFWPRARRQFRVGPLASTLSFLPSCLCYQYLHPSKTSCNCCFVVQETHLSAPSTRRIQSKQNSRPKTPLLLQALSAPNDSSPASSGYQRGLILTSNTALGYGPHISARRIQGGTHTSSECQDMSSELELCHHCCETVRTRVCLLL